MERILLIISYIGFLILLPIQLMIYRNRYNRSVCGWEKVKFPRWKLIWAIIIYCIPIVNIFIFVIGILNLRSDIIDGYSRLELGSPIPILEKVIEFLTKDLNSKSK